MRFCPQAVNITIQGSTECLIYQHRAYSTLSQIRDPFYSERHVPFGCMATGINWFYHTAQHLEVDSKEEG